VENKKVLLLIGSPKKERSTSFTIGKYLMKRLHANDCNKNSIFINDALKSKDGIDEMINKFNESDIILLCYPLYVDSIPAPIIRAFELITEGRRKLKRQKNQIFFAAGNCGYYEGSQIENSANVCRIFATENELSWYGSMSIGAGGIYSGKELEALGGMATRLRSALDLTAESILNNSIIPMEKIQKLTTPPFPRFFYQAAVTISFKSEAKKNNCYKSMNHRPYI
jgi:multimeric flavodoxin WrbA